MPDDYSPPRLYRLCPFDAHTCIEPRCLSSEACNAPPIQPNQDAPPTPLIALNSFVICPCGKWRVCKADPGARCANLPIPTP
jgi:hypothetical protein